MYARTRSTGRSMLAALACSALLVGMLIGIGQTRAEAVDGDPPVAVLLKDIQAGSPSSSPALYVEKGDAMFFLTFAGSQQGLWKTDGTPEGTVRVKALSIGYGSVTRSGSTYATPPLTLIGDTLFFTASDSTHGFELWKSDGTAEGTGMVKDIQVPGDSSPYEFQVMGSTLLFATRYDDVHGGELWKSDGTEAGTVMIKDINTRPCGTGHDQNAVCTDPPGTARSLPAGLTVVGNVAYFSAEDGINGIEPWKTDGTEAGTVMIKNISVPECCTGNPEFDAGYAASSSSEPTEFAAIGSTVYFAARDGGIALDGFTTASSGRELWKTDGTEAGTVMLKDIRSGESSNPLHLTPFGAGILFQADGGVGTGAELWSTDGTAAGTAIVKDIWPGTSPSPTPSQQPIPNASNPDRFFVNGTVAYFTANDANGRELWKTDGTATGTELVKDVNPGPASSNRPYDYPDVAPVGADMYFTADDGTHGRELWKSDGTSAGTVMVKDANPGSAGSSPQFTTPGLGTLFFAANGPGTGVEPWTLGPDTGPAGSSIAPGVSINDPSVKEGDDGTPTTARFTLTRTGPLDEGASVAYKTSNGTATTASNDYVTKSGIANFFSEQSSTDVTVTVNGDALPEANETFKVTLSPVKGAPPVVIADATGTATIENDDGAAYLSVADVVVPEHNSGTTTTATFTITRSGTTAGTSTVKVKTSGGTAIGGSAGTTGADYAPIAVGTPVTFNPTETEKSVSTTVFGDADIEKNETFTFGLSAPQGATVSDTAATATIVNDDGPGPFIAGPATFLTVADVSVLEGSSGTTAATFTVTRSGDTGVASTVTYTTGGGKATPGTDYSSRTGTLTVPAGGAATQTVTVPVLGDGLPEANETFNLALSKATGAVASDPTGTATIGNDDGTAFLSVADISVYEGSSSTSSALATFTVIRSENTSGTSTVKYTTGNGTATAGSDFAAESGTITFDPWEASKVVNIVVTGDTTFEPNETFKLTLSTAVGATIADTSATATIVNDD